MAIQPTYPGVYVQEEPSGVRTITGVSTSTAVFIGRAKQGPMNEPALCLSYPDFERVFSSENAYSELSASVRLFFQNGGTRCYVMRIADGATAAEVVLSNVEAVPVLRVTAKSMGSVGETIRLAVTYPASQPELAFNLEVFRWAVNRRGGLEKQDREYWENLSMDPESARYAIDLIKEQSSLIELTAEGTLPGPTKGFALSGRPTPRESAPVFWAFWHGLLKTGIGLVDLEPEWTGTSIPVASGAFTGDIRKTYIFTVENPAPGYTLPLGGGEEIKIHWGDDHGHTGELTLTDAYVPDPENGLEVAEGLSLSFPAGSLIDGETFRVEAGPPANRFRISLDGGKTFGNVDLSSLDFESGDLDQTNAITNLAGKIEDIINGVPQLPIGASVSVSLVDNPGVPPKRAYKLLRIEGGTDAVHYVRIEPAFTNDLARPLRLGTAQGGLEVSGFTHQRPAPTGTVFDPSSDGDNYKEFIQEWPTAFQILRIGPTEIDLEDTMITALAGKIPSVQDFCTVLAGAVNDYRLSHPEFRWKAEVWGSRLALVPGDGGDNSIGAIMSSGPDGTDIGSWFTTNVRYYSVGSTTSGTDGNAPTLRNYRDAFEILDKEVDLFNLMILPRDKGHTNTTTAELWGPASECCRQQRAFLLMDPPKDAWPNVQDATHPSDGVNSLRIGLVKDYSAVFYPDVEIRYNELKTYVGPSGAIAGLMARIDANRGVWKASAGTEADIRGVIGLKYRFSDQENGVLNPRAVNTLRIFPNGIVNWGARTMDGDDDFSSEWKYIPVRRTALFIEESLYRGLKWVVFEPNDEPLWAQIRLNVGAFMHNLFRQGAFQGQSKKEAYFVKCDAETTTQNDINLGIVNVWVGFAPLKPAEFVIIHLQQMAGQIQV